ncbi:MAG: translation initiation factor IF-2 associated domain-containing protein, partial [Rhodanobacter sp.]|nr:translation initiation factor IF-2 associated domain-containing protein [Rhodanobacter sp.]
MSDVTIKQLAQVLGMPVDKLLSQLGEAGMKFSDQEQVISSTEKVKLLGFLRRTHGKTDTVAEVDGSAPRQITLKRRTVGELKVPAPGGRGVTGTAKTVNVEVRAKRTYVKRSVIAEEASVDGERVDAKRKLLESEREREQEDQDRIEAERRRQEEAQQRADEDAQRKQERDAQDEAAKTVVAAAAVSEGVEEVTPEHVPPVAEAPAEKVEVEVE